MKQCQSFKIILYHYLNTFLMKMSTWWYRGVSKMTTFVSNGGWCQNRLKFCPRGLYIPGGLHVFHLGGGANPLSDKFLHFRPVTLREFASYVTNFFGGGLAPPTMRPRAAPHGLYMPQRSLWMTTK